MLTINNVSSLLKKIINYICTETDHYQSLVVVQNKDGSHTNLYFKSFSFSDKSLSADLLLELKTLFADSETINSVIYSCGDLYLRAILRNYFLNGGVRFHLNELCESESVHIYNDILGGGTFKVEVRVLAELESGLILQGWNVVPSDCIENTLLGYRSGANEDGFLSRLRYTTTLSSDLSLFDQSDNQSVLVNEIETIFLSLSLGLRQPIKIDEIKVISKGWKFNPKTPMQFHRMYGYWDDSYKNASSNSFWSKAVFNKNISLNEKSLAFNSWLEIIRSARGSKAPLSLIMRGIWTAFSLSNFPSFQKDSKALDAISDILIGMEGLTIRSYDDLGSVKKFITSWTKILSCSRFDSQNPKKLLNSLYKLRCALAHGDYSEIDSLLKKSKLDLGDTFNKSSYSSEDVAYCLSFWLLKTIDIFIQNKTLLKELYTEKTYGRFYSLKLSWNKSIKEHLLFDIKN